MYIVRITNLRIWIYNTKYILNQEISLNHGHVPMGGVLDIIKWMNS